jgi:hypothetical protein
VPSHEDLRRMVRQRVADRTLPRTRPRRAWGGSGLGLLCDVCDLPVTADQSELQVEFADDHQDAPMLRALHLHTVCFAIWELERTDGPGPSAER